MGGGGVQMGLVPGAPPRVLCGSDRCKEYKSCILLNLGIPSRPSRATCHYIFDSGCVNKAKFDLLRLTNLAKV